jgi:hypothetical protein
VLPSRICSRCSVRRVVFRGRDVDRYLLPAELPGSYTQEIERQVFRNCRGCTERRFSGL